jgi:glycosyltransferase involved in cell wall biosynthesis
MFIRGFRVKMTGSANRKHVVIIGKYYPPVFGGIEKYTSLVANSLSRNYRVTVLVHNAAPQDLVECEGNVTIIRCGTKRIVKAQPISPSMWKHLRLLKPDLIQFNAPNFWASALLNIIHRRCPIIVTHHADVFGRRALKLIVIPFYHALVRRSRHVIVNSMKNAKISTDLPKTIPSVVELPHGVDDNLYRTENIDRDALRAARFSDDAFVVGFVGRFVRYKGLSVLTRALAEVKDVHAVIIGDGPLRSKLEEEIRTFGLSDRVYLTGSVNESRKLEEMACMDALMFPSLETTEAFGVVQVEAQLLGMPVIASDLPTGVTDITDNTTGILVPPGDHIALADAIRKLRDDRRLGARLGQAGRQRALARFTLRTFEKQMLDLVDSCLREDAPALLKQEHRLAT